MVASILLFSILVLEIIFPELFDTKSICALFFSMRESIGSSKHFNQLLHQYWDAVCITMLLVPIHNGSTSFSARLGRALLISSISVVD